MNENESLKPDAGSATAPQDLPSAQAPASWAPTQPAEPGVAPPRPGPAGQNRPLPETLTAARDAAAFVAQLFTEVSAPEQPLPTEPPVAAPDAPGEAAPAATEPAGEQGLALLQGQPVLILGLGASGLAMARWCARQGARVTVADTRADPPQLAQLQAELPQVTFRAGAFGANLIEGHDIRAVFKSPGLTPAVVAPVWQAAQACWLPAKQPPKQPRP